MENKSSQWALCTFSAVTLLCLCLIDYDVDTVALGPDAIMQIRISDYSDLYSCTAGVGPTWFQDAILKFN